MLVLGRNPGESVRLYRDGKFLGAVTFIKPLGQRARLGFEFEDDVRIVRDEVDEIYQDDGNPVGQQ